MKRKILIFSSIVSSLMSNVSYVFAQGNEITNPALGQLTQKSAGEGLAFYIAQLWRAIVVAGGIAFVIYLLWGGVEYMTAAGDKTKIDNAQHKITNSFTGLAILVGSYAAIRLISGIFQINLLQPIFPQNF